MKLQMLHNDSNRRRRRLSLLTAAMLSLALLPAMGCSKEGDVVVKTAEGDELGEREIDADPLALLPGGANV